LRNQPWTPADVSAGMQDQLTYCRANHLVAVGVLTRIAWVPLETVPKELLERRPGGRPRFSRIVGPLP
jgi:hypothetical protein